MNSSAMETTELLRIENVELYQTKNEYGALIDKGTLLLLYVQDFDWFIIKINEFQYGLSKNIPVLASHHENDSLATYVFVGTEGYYIVKIPTVSRKEDLETFEEILKHNTQFTHREGLADEGLPVEIKEGGVKIRRSVSEGQKKEEPQDFNAAFFVYNGGKATKSAMIGSARVLSSGISKLGEIIQSNYLGERQEMQIDPKTMSRVALVNSATGILSSVGSLYVRGLTTVGNWLARRIEPKFEQKKEEAEAKAELREQTHKPTGTIGDAAIHSAVTIWSGMVEALDIIREGITETTSGIVTCKYGSAAGEVFRSGIGIATNLRLPGNKVFKSN